MDSSPLFAILPSSCSSSWMVFFLFETDGRDSSCWGEVGSVYGSFFDPSFTSFTGDTAAIFSSICKDKEKLLLGCYNNHSNHDKTYVIEWKMSLLNPCRIWLLFSFYFGDTCPQSGKVLKDPVVPFCQLTKESSRDQDFLRVSSFFFI